MISESASSAKARAGRAVPDLSAPRGVLVMGVYLVGMTAIAATVHGLRDQPGPQQAQNQGFGAEIRVDHFATTMLPPASGGTVSLMAGLNPPDHANSSGTPAPRLAALEPSDTRIDGELAAPLSRIFTGAPPAVPPARPSRERLENAIATRATEPSENRHVQVSLRPHLRPEGLPTTPTASVARLARQARAQAPDDTPRTRTVLPATPRIARASGRCPGRLSGDMPRRPGSAPPASAVMASVEGIDGVERDRQVTREILSGNMPRFLHNLRPVTISGRTADGTNAEITLCVTPDYLAIGEQSDYVRVPLGLRAATRIGDAFNMLLPTPRMVDMIYRAADSQLAPSPMPPGPEMTSTDYLLRHNAKVEIQRQQAGAAAGTLISGHKKDVVLSTRLTSMRGRVAIYGWHRRNGQPIQPLSTVHGAGYADYSHGVRLVSRTAFLNGEEVDLRSLMADQRYAGLLSDEGPVTGPRLRMANLAAN